MSARPGRRRAGGARRKPNLFPGRGESLRSAFVLSALCVALCMLARVLLARWGGAGLFSVWAQALASLLCFGLPAALGLGVPCGDRTILPGRALSAAQVRYLALLGALLVAPASLLTDILSGARVRLFGSGASGAAAALPPAPWLFLPLVVRSAVIAPLCEELFFRGYLLGVLDRAENAGRTGCSGGARAVALSAAVFALAHGSNFALYAVLGLLLGALTLRTRSLLAPILVHAVYNLAVIALAYLGADALLTGLGPLACVLRVALCAPFFALFKRLWALGAFRQAARWGEGWTRQELALLGACAALALILPVIVEVMAR